MINENQDDIELSPQEAGSASTAFSAIEVLEDIDALEALSHNLRFKESPILHFDTFILWIKLLSERKMQYDEVYRARCGALRIRRMHQQELGSAASAENNARRQWEACHEFARYRRLEKEVSALQNTLRGVMASKHPQGSAKYERMMQVFEASTTKLAQKQQEMEVIENTTPEYIIWKDTQKELAQLRQSIGLIDAEDFARAAEKEQGSNRHNAGLSFEAFAQNVVEANIMPRVAKKHNVEVEQLRYVRNVTLGMGGAAGSTAEIDGMIYTRELCEVAGETSSAKYSCRVLGVVEVKRNAEDIAAAFESYQKCLAWLCGLEEYYDASDYITKYYRHGHFDRSFEHTDEQGDVLIFSSASFGGIRPASYILNHDPCSHCGHHAPSERSLFAEDLYFITKNMAIDNITSGESNFTVHSLSSRLEYDEEFGNSEAYENLRQILLQKFEVSHERVTVSSLLNMYMKYNLNAQLYVIEWSRKKKLPETLG